MSRHWMPLYVADYLADTRRLTMAEHGAYMLLIMEYWRNGGLPNDERRLARIVGASEEEWAAVRDNIAEFFCEGWRHKRIDDELAKSGEVSERRAAAANKRWQGKNNANADASAYAKPMRSQSQSELDTNVSNNIASRTIASGLFDLFYDSYGKRKNRKAAEAKFAAAVRRGVDPDHIICAAKRYADAHARAGTDPQFIPAPDVWLNKGGYDDEDLPQAARAGPSAQPSSRGGFASLWLKSNGFVDEQSGETRRADENVSEFPRLTVDERVDGGGDAGGLSGNLIELFAANSS